MNWKLGGIGGGGEGLYNMKEEIKNINTGTGSGTDENAVTKKETRQYVKKDSVISESSGTFRVVIAKEANEALEELVTKVGVGFDAGSITKSDVANFVFQNLVKYFSESDIKALRSLHFDDKKVLSSILKNEIDLPEEIKKAIRFHYGVSEKPTKKNSKTSNEFSTFHSVDKSKITDSVA